MKQRVLKMAVLPEGEPIFSERGFTVSIEDEAGGEFLKLESHMDDNYVSFEASQWPALRDLIDKMAKEVRE